MTRILGISAYYHDAAACLIVDGDIIAAAQEERFTRVKYDAAFPLNAILYCLKEGNIDASKLDFVAFYDKPFSKFERLLETYLAFAPRGFRSFAKSLPIWIKDKLFQKATITKALASIDNGLAKWEKKLVFSEHHLSHAASAFYPSPFQEAAILTIDGVGEWASTSVGAGKGQYLDLHQEIRFPHSLGLLYSAFTYYLGFKVNSGEYKVMGLAPYGEPRYAKLIKEQLIDVREDGSFALNLSYFDYCTGLKMTNSNFDNLFGGPRRVPESPLTIREMDIAASIQAVSEDIIFKLAKHTAKITGQRNLCLAGGVALNCVANGKLHQQGLFENIWIPSAAGDAGGAMGAALATHHLMLGNTRNIKVGQDSLKGGYLGPSFDQHSIEQQLSKCQAVYSKHEESEMIEITAHALASGQAVGWFQGRMEFGPRALGGRSILADPRSPDMQKHLNLKIKYRESFRPFAPSIIREDLEEWFELNVDSPYMLLVATVSPLKRIKPNKEEEGLNGFEKLNTHRSKIPAVTHVDYTARIQTVHKDTNPIYYKLLSKFKEITGCPILVNTSFNVRGEPIICSPYDAYRCFISTQLDLLVIGNNILHKSNQPDSASVEIRADYEPD